MKIKQKVKQIQLKKIIVFLVVFLVKNDNFDKYFFLYKIRIVCFNF